MTIRVVIPAPYPVAGLIDRYGVNSSGNPDCLWPGGKTLDSPVSSTGQAYQVRNDVLRNVISETVH
jgi:hypothetical protein